MFNSDLPGRRSLNIEQDGSQPVGVSSQGATIHGGAC
jgi:hypothetical protein